ncbi:MAG: GNAT family N-acetyltransferase [Acidobacteria bacterium]|nr:GNAT family N-acetyltransferase [Acidobacteriota bacterium]
MVYNEWQRGDCTISTERARLDLHAIHEFLSTKSYWARGRSFELVQRAVENSLPFGLYRGARQIGFARVVTDYATFAWLADVYVLDEFRGEGLGKWLVEVTLSHSELQNLRRWILGTRDAHELYRHFGFVEVERPEFYMHRMDAGAASTPAPPEATGGGE